MISCDCQQLFVGVCERQATIFTLVYNIYGVYLYDSLYAKYKYKP